MCLADTASLGVACKLTVGPWCDCQGMQRASAPPAASLMDSYPSQQPNMPSADVLSALEHPRPQLEPALGPQEVEVRRAPCKNWRHQQRPRFTASKFGDFMPKLQLLCLVMRKGMRLCWWCASCRHVS